MFSTHLTVDLRCCASVSNHGMVQSVQVSVKKLKRMPALGAFSRAFVWHSVNPSFFIGASLRVAGATTGAAKYHACQEDEDQVVMRFCMDTFHGEGFAVIFEAPYVPSCNNDHISGKDGHWSSGSARLSMPNLLRKFFRGLLFASSPRGSGQARHLFGHVASCVWPSSRVPNCLACGRRESDRILAGFSGRLQHGELPELFPAFLDTVGSRKPIQEETWSRVEKRGHEHLNMELRGWQSVTRQNTCHSSSR